jgi:hypothetical protein
MRTEYQVGKPREVDCLDTVLGRSPRRLVLERAAAQWDDQVRASCTPSARIGAGCSA